MKSAPGKVSLRVESAAFSPDGAHVVTGSSDNTMRIWDVSDTVAAQ